MRLAFTPFEPDAAELDSGMMQVARNVFPERGSYRPVPGPVAYSDALDGNPRGLWLARRQDSGNVSLAATQTKIKELTDQTWGDLATGYTGPPADDNWAGVQFGDKFYFNNITDGLQVWDVELGGAVSAVGGASPGARSMDAFGEYLMAGGLASDTWAVAWSATADGSTWSGGNAGSQPFKDGGAVLAVVGATNTVIQEYAIRNVISDPGGDIFLFEKVEQAKGAIAPGSVIKFAGTYAYLAEGGFWWNGRPIGHGRVDRYFFGLVNEDRIFSTLGVLDPFRPLFHWLFRTTDSDLYDRALTYNWARDLWSEWLPNAYFAAASATPGISLEALSAIYGNLETVPFSLDSRVWQGNRPVLAIIDEDLKLAFVEGANLEATLEPGERALVQGKRMRLLGAKPIVDTNSALLSVRKRARIGDAGTWSAEKAVQSSGRCRFNDAGQFHRFRMRIPAGTVWTQAQGIEIGDSDLVPAGDR